MNDNDSLNDNDGTHERGTRGGESFRLDIVALRSDVPVYTRLKSVCKRLLRSFQFRLVRISETTAKRPPLPAPPPAAQAPACGEVRPRRSEQ